MMRDNQELQALPSTHQPAYLETDYTSSLIFDCVFSSKNQPPIFMETSHLFATKAATRLH